MKKWSCTSALLLCAVMLFASCGSSEDVSTWSKVAVSFATQNQQYYLDIKSGLESQTVNLKLTLSSVDAQRDPKKQLIDVKNLLNGKPDVLAVAPVEEGNIQPVMEACNAAGVKVILLGDYPAIEGIRQIPLDPTQDGKTVGVQIAQTAVELLKDGADK